MIRTSILSIVVFYGLLRTRYRRIRRVCCSLRGRLASSTSTLFDACLRISRGIHLFIIEFLLYVIFDKFIGFIWNIRNLDFEIFNISAKRLNCSLTKLHMLIKSLHLISNIKNLVNFQNQTNQSLLAYQKANFPSLSNSLNEIGNLILFISYIFNHDL